MNEQNKNNIPKQRTAITRMPADRAATSQLALELADAAWLDRIQQGETNHETLGKLRAQDYMVARNGLEKALGISEPYGDQQVAELRENGQIPPEPEK